VLFTDMIMPHMSGKERSERVAASHPHTRTPFTSAFTGNAIAHLGSLTSRAALRPKPFTPTAPAHTLREVLDYPTEGDR
jgi:hypothetical protein